MARDHRRGPPSSQLAAALDRSLLRPPLLRADPAVECEGSSWYTLLALGVIGTAVYSFGFPLLCFLLSRVAAHSEDDAAAAEPSTSTAGEASAQMAAEASTGEGAVSRRRRERAMLLVRSCAQRAP